MGMAASQARYLALTARKTNTEWEGQQINQARTALANQSANLFNRLLNMEVPNAPKTTDYTELQYSYSDGDNESVLEDWKKLSNADPNYNYVVTHYYMAEVYTGSKKQMQNPQVQLGDVLKEKQYDSSNVTVTTDANGNITVTYKVADEEKNAQYNKLTQEQIDSDSKLKNNLTDFETAKGYAKSDGTLNTDDVYGYQDSDGIWHFFVANEYDKINQEQNSKPIKTSINKEKKKKGLVKKKKVKIQNKSEENKKAKSETSKKEKSSSKSKSKKKTVSEGGRKKKKK